MLMRWSAALLFMGVFLAGVAIARGRFDGVALLAVLMVLGALGRWFGEETRRGRGN